MHKHRVVSTTRMCACHLAPPLLLSLTLLAALGRRPACSGRCAGSTGRLGRSSIHGLNSSRHRQHEVVLCRRNRASKQQQVSNNATMAAAVQPAANHSTQPPRMAVFVHDCTD